MALAGNLGASVQGRVALGARAGAPFDPDSLVRLPIKAKAVNLE